MVKMGVLGGRGKEELYEEECVTEEWGCPLCGDKGGEITLFKDEKSGKVVNAICNLNSMMVKRGMCIVLHLAATSANAGLFKKK